MANPIDKNLLRPYSYFFMNGIVDFSRVTKLIDGEELQRDIDHQRSVLKTRFPITIPYTRLNLQQVTTLCTDPNAMTLEEQFCANLPYLSVNHPEKGYCYTATNRGKVLPKIIVRDEKGDWRELAANEILGELDQGLHVTVGFKVFKTQSFGISFGMELIYVNEPIRFYQASNISQKELAAMGLAFTPAPVVAAPASAPTAEPQTQMPAAQPQTQPPVSAPTGNPFTSAPAAAPQNPVQTAAQQMPFPGTQMPMQSMPAPMPAAAPYGQVYQQPAAPVTPPAPTSFAGMNPPQPMNPPVQPGYPAEGGIRYNADDRQY